LCDGAHTVTSATAQASRDWLASTRANRARSGSSKSFFGK